MSPSRNLVAITLLGALLLSGCGSGNGQQKMPDPEVGVITIERQPVALSDELPGQTVPFMISDVRPQVNGIILKRLFTEGSEVKAGQVLYQIDPKPYQAAYDSAKASMVAAKVLADRYKALLAENAIAKQTYDNALASYLEAKAALETARINLDYTRVTAPISGRIGISSVTEGALVTANQTTALTTIQTLDPMYVDVSQSSAQLLQLKQAVQMGQVDPSKPMTADVQLILPDGTTYAQKGKLQFTDVTVNSTTGSVTVRALFPNPHEMLLPGLLVVAKVEEGIQPNAILAPQQGVIRDAKGEATALVAGKDGKVELRVLTIARSVGNEWLISKGLAAGDRLIVQGIQKVQPGQTVRTVTVKLPAFQPDAPPPVLGGNGSASQEQ